MPLDQRRPVLDQRPSELGAAAAPEFVAPVDGEAPQRHQGRGVVIAGGVGGAVITAAGTDDRVAGLVYIAALGPDADETSQSLQDKFPTTALFAHIGVADGRIWMLPSGIGYFAGDLPEQEQKLVWATQGVPDAGLFNQQLPGTAWRTKPSWYVVANNDQTVNPELERFVAKRMGAHTYD